MGWFSGSGWFLEVVRLDNAGKTKTLSNACVGPLVGSHEAQVLTPTGPTATTSPQKVHQNLPNTSPTAAEPPVGWFGRVRGVVRLDTAEKTTTRNNACLGPLVSSQQAPVLVPTDPKSIKKLTKSPQNLPKPSPNLAWGCLGLLWMGLGRVLGRDRGGLGVVWDPVGFNACLGPLVSRL